MGFIIGSTALSATAETTEIFMPGTQDIPLMNSLLVDTTDDMNFDTPAGQVITFEAKSSKETSRTILNYYRNTLPALGWKETTPNHYLREKDSLIFTVMQAQKPAVIRVEITLMNTAD